ncbi:polyprenyl synthetase family protein [Phytohabitans kaempferiae]|uniref:Polyprenyl synthetase family protein n=1 Tax=Phytohabitans kaempferiae TaxID=1620943 RepID=A0ABV6M4R5_9ACTN
MTLAPTERTDSVRYLVEPAIRRALDRLHPNSRLVAGYQLGLWDTDGSPADACGKWLRPALALLSARAAGGDPERGVPAAAAVELAHTFSLLHDDVMDGDTERRHRPTAWTAFGVGPAILAGDALLGLAVELLAEAPADGAAAAHRLSVDVGRLVAGQAADLEFERRDDVTLDECLAMASDKTGALFACAATLGAMLCDGPPALLAALSRFGGQLGLAFQLVDDLLGIWGDSRRTGKATGADLRIRKRSTPVVWAITAGGPAGRALADLYRLPRTLNEEEVDRAAQLVEAAGAREWAVQRAEQEIDQALAQLEEVPMPADARQELSDLAVFAVRRDR